MPRTRPPRDSWIIIKPGQSFVFDREVMGEAQRTATSFGREVRGAVLACGFEIEWIIDQILLQTFLPAPENAEAKRAQFDDLFLKRSPLRFAHKIRILKSVHKARPDIQAALPAESLALLDKVRNTRNDFAHYPVNLVPTGPEPISKFTPILAGPEEDLELNDASVKEMFEQFASVTNALNEALKRILPAHSGEA